MSQCFQQLAQELGSVLSPGRRKTALIYIPVPPDGELEALKKP